MRTTLAEWFINHYGNLMLYLNDHRQVSNIEYAHFLLHGYQPIENGPTEILQLGQNEVLAINEGAFDEMFAGGPFRIMIYGRSQETWAPQNTLIHYPQIDGMEEVPSDTYRIINLYHSGSERDDGTGAEGHFELIVDSAIRTVITTASASASAATPSKRKMSELLASGAGAKAPSTSSSSSLHAGTIH